jgi:hypothetical protein
VNDSNSDANRVSLAQAVRNLRENLPALLEMEDLQAKLSRKKFLCLVAEGFTETQALELCRKVI